MTNNNPINNPNNAPAWLRNCGGMHSLFSLEYTNERSWFKNLYQLFFTYHTASYDRVPVIFNERSVDKENQKHNDINYVKQVILNNNPSLQLIGSSTNQCEVNVNIYGSEKRGRSTDFFMYATDDSVLYLEKDRKNNLEIKVYSVLGQEEINKLFCSEQIDYKKLDDEDTNRNNINILYSEGPGAIWYKTLKNSTNDYIAGNYSPTVQEAYANVVNCIKTNDNKSVGRLVILAGAPGTGKTHFIKALPNNIDNSLFLFVPPMMIEQIGRPEMISSLIDIFENANSEDYKSLTLILEDADNCLRSRSLDNTTLVSALLNACAGIIGDSLNLKVIATTNIKKPEIDDALIRSGRLLDYVEFAALGDDQANEIYKRLMEDPNASYDNNSVRDKNILSNIYAYAGMKKNVAGSNNHIKNKLSKTGFGF